MKNIVKLSVIAVIFVSLISIMVYGTAQQLLRLEANSVPLQLTIDVIAKLESGIAAKSVPLPDTIEISKSLFSFVLILDQNKNVLVSSATLNGAIPVIPQGTFDYVAKRGQDKVTWQPEPGIREAIVIDKYSVGDSTGFVVAGTSLKLTEDIIDKLGKDILIGWFVISIFTVASIVFLEISKKG